MDITKVCMLSTLLISSFIQLGLPSSCFCTKEDGVSLFEDEELTKIATVVPNNNTCFIGSNVRNNYDKPNEEIIIRIEDFSLGRCGDDFEQPSTHVKNLFRNGSSYANLSFPYFGIYNNFIESSPRENKKRFLLLGQTDTGLWTEWSQWTGCSEGDIGMFVRSRTCTNPIQSSLGKTCEGETVQIKNCPEVAEWNEWQSWGFCRKTFSDVYIQFRNRSCSIEDRVDSYNSTCQENERLSYRPCQSYGIWTAWGEWSQCSLPFPGTKIRTRTCDWSKAVDHVCLGNATESVNCYINGEWNQWSTWSSCSVTCDSGMLTRTRTCANKIGMKDCVGQTSEKKVCITGLDCPVDGGYTMWSEWSTCPVTCGHGAVHRTRYCTNPSPQFGGKNCSTLGTFVEANFCYMPCPIDGHWGSWLPWGACSASCDDGVKARERKCDNPPASNGGLPCEGVNTSTENCTLHTCNVDGNWGQWSEWSQCSCDHAQSRHRVCNNPTPAGGGQYCAGNASEEEACQPNSLLACPVNGGWGEWFEWSSRCSVTCDQGITKRVRQCSNPVPHNGGVYCIGDLYDIKPCIESPCPRDGVFATWSSWGVCSVTCGNGTQVRNRTCDPPPMYGGANCTGIYQEHKTCVQNPCPIDGGWSDWGSWSNWDRTCSFASRIRSRDCDNPAPQHHGRICFGEFNHTESTDLGHCPVDGNWGSWESWTSCSVTCENGTHSRIRKCDNPTPQYNGSDCLGNETDVSLCIDIPSCVVDGMWAEWTSWFGCSSTCGPGQNTRYRTCSNPRPQNGGSTCRGSFMDVNSCNLVECTVDGQWTDWSAWGDCSVTCENGTQTRSRKCTSPSPQFGGQDCQGHVDEIQPCTMTQCPINGSWSGWSTWSDCSKSCGNSTKTRVRDCDSPKPQNNGLNCLGLSKEETDCTQPPCPEFHCYVCDGSIPELCASMTKIVACPEPYCINELNVDYNGEKLLDKRCGTKQECDLGWWIFTSDNEKCLSYEDSYSVANNIHCTFCCTDDFCNKPIVPSRDSLYLPNT